VSVLGNLTNNNWEYSLLYDNGEVKHLDKDCFVSSYFFSCERLAFQSKTSKKWGFLDKTGKPVIQAQYRSVNSFSENIASVVHEDGTLGFIDTFGNDITPAEYKTALDGISVYYYWAGFNDGYALASDRTKDKLIVLQNRSASYYGYDTWLVPWEDSICMFGTTYAGHIENFTFNNGGKFALDFSNAEGTKLYAPASGKIQRFEGGTEGADGPSYKTTDGMAHYGNYIMFIPDGFGTDAVLNNCVIMAHFKDFTKDIDDRIRSGNYTIKKGELLGYMGNTGNSSAPHLHFEIVAPNESVKSVFGIKTAMDGDSTKAIFPGSMPSGVKITSGKYDIESGGEGTFVTGAEQKTQADEFLRYISENDGLTLKVLDKDGKSTAPAQLVGTGMKIAGENEEILGIIIIYGDLDGDGEIKQEDYQAVQSHVAYNADINVGEIDSAISMKAAKSSLTGERIDIEDLMYIRSEIEK
jgi:murein DD-endopeptidase MepM/ murein hydrolase activator NlpD